MDQPAWIILILSVCVCSARFGRQRRQSGRRVSPRDVLLVMAVCWAAGWFALGLPSLIAWGRHMPWSEIVPATLLLLGLATAPLLLMLAAIWLPRLSGTTEMPERNRSLRTCSIDSTLLRASARRLAAQFVDVLVCQTSGDRQAMLRGILQYNPDGAAEVAEVAGGDEERPDAIASAQHGPDLPSLQHERHVCAACRARLLVLTAEPRLGAADCWNVQPQSEMAGQSDSARMRDPLPVDQEDIGRLAQRLIGLEKHRSLAEAEKPGNVREPRLRNCPAPFQDFLRASPRDHDRTVEPFPADVVRDVGCADRVHRTHRPRHIHARGKLQLQRTGLLRIDIPGMECRDSWHGQNRIIPGRGNDRAPSITLQASSGRARPRGGESRSSPWRVGPARDYRFARERDAASASPGHRARTLVTEKPWNHRDNEEQGEKMMDQFWWGVPSAATTQQFAEQAEILVRRRCA